MKDGGLGSLGLASHLWRLGFVAHSNCWPPTGERVKWGLARGRGATAGEEGDRAVRRGVAAGNRRGRSGSRGREGTHERGARERDGFGVFYLV